MLQILDSKVNKTIWASLKSTDGLPIPSSPCQPPQVTTWRSSRTRLWQECPTFIALSNRDVVKPWKPTSASFAACHWWLRVRYIKFYVLIERIWRVNKLVQVFGGCWKAGGVGYESFNDGVEDVLYGSFHRIRELFSSESTQEGLGRCHGQLVDPHQEQLHGRTARGFRSWSWHDASMHGNLSLLVCGVWRFLLFFCLAIRRGQ